MSEVFISYASANDLLVRQRLEPLRAHSISFWFAPDQNAILGGTYYGEQIAEAICACKVLLLMATRDALQSEDVLRELELAARHKVPIVPLLLEADLIIPRGFAYRLALEQRLAATETDVSWFDALMETLRHYNVYTSDRTASAGRPANKKRPISGILPYLADRDTQEGMILSALDEHLDRMPRRPIVFIVHGEEAQCSDMFLERLARCSLPSFLERRKRSSEMEWRSLRWPERLRADVEHIPRLELYRRALLSKLEQPLNIDGASFMKYLGALRRPIVFTSIIGACDQDEVGFVNDVVRWWSEVPDVWLPCQPLIILLSITYAAPQSLVITQLFGARARQSIASRLVDLESPAPTAIRLVVLPELSSLSLADVENWVREVMQPSEVDDILRIVRAVFSGRRNVAEQSLRMALDIGPEDPALRLLRTVLQAATRSKQIPMDPLAPFLKRLLRSESVLRSI